MLVMRQLSAVLDAYLAHVTRGEGLTPQDVLVLGWLAQKQGMSSANIGACIGRPRQSVQRALERYEAHGLTERFPTYIRKRTEGWGLTEKGLSLWGRIECGFAEQEREFARRGLDVRRLVFDLEELMVGLMAATRHMSRVGLIETPLVHEEPSDGDH